MLALVLVTLSLLAAVSANTAAAAYAYMGFEVPPTILLERIGQEQKTSGSVSVLNVSFTRARNLSIAASFSSVVCLDETTFVSE